MFINRISVLFSLFNISLYTKNDQYKGLYLSGKLAANMSHWPDLNLSSPAFVEIALGVEATTTNFPIKIINIPKWNPATSVHGCYRIFSNWILVLGTQEEELAGSILRH